MMMMTEKISDDVIVMTMMMMGGGREGSTSWNPCRYKGKDPDRAKDVFLLCNDGNFTDVESMIRGALDSLYERFTTENIF